MMNATKTNPLHLLQFGAGTTQETFSDGMRRLMAPCGCEWNGTGLIGTVVLCETHEQEEIWRVQAEEEDRVASS